MTALSRLPNELEEIDATDDNLLDDAASLSSITLLPEAAKEPAEDIPEKVDAIYYLKTCHWQQISDIEMGDVNRSY